jgi:hypothetical protein
MKIEYEGMPISKFIEDLAIVAKRLKRHLGNLEQREKIFVQDAEMLVDGFLMISEHFEEEVERSEERENGITTR